MSTILPFLFLAKMEVLVKPFLKLAHYMIDVP